MKWLKKLSHRFWIWIDKKIVTHRVIERIDQAKQTLADDIGRTLYGGTAGIEGLDHIIDDGTDMMTIDEEQLVRATYPEGDHLGAAGFTNINYRGEPVEIDDSTKTDFWPEDSHFAEEAAEAAPMTFTEPIAPIVKGYDKP